MGVAMVRNLHFERAEVPADLSGGRKPSRSGTRCNHCRAPYPCETIMALDAEEDWNE